MTEKKNKKDSEVAPIEDVFKKMKKHYDNDPKDWRIIGSKDKHGNTDTFIGKTPNTYWLKSKMLSPLSALSQGTVVKNLDKEIDDVLGNTLSPNDILRLFGMVVPVKNDQNIMAAGIEKFSQEHGEFLKKVIDEKNPNLGYQMARKLDEDFTKKHPQRKNLYM